MNDTLKHMTCGCAVHNIIMDFDPNAKPLWMNVFITTIFSGRCFYPEEYTGENKEQIDSTGYTLNELADIEYSFEKDRCTKDIFGCLMNVIDQLAIIHNVDLSAKESAKQLFCKGITL